MKRSLSDWANIAEILAAVAIVLSLIFVGLEVRSNTQVARAAVYERNIESLNQWRLELARDPELARMANQFLERLDEDATEAEVGHQRLRHLITVLFGIYEKSFVANQYGIMADDEWERFARLACANRERTVSEQLWEDVESLLTQEFAEFLESNCR
jgi:hypothetical protein